MISYLIWNGSPEIFSFGSFALRWYGLLFALGFLISQQILFYMFKKEGKPERDVEILTIYMVVATVIGARLGHIIFYEPQTIWTDPLSIFLPFEFSPEFKFTGLQGLASHGGAFAILFALWLYARKKKPGQNFLQTVDRIVIVVALTGALIRTGNFFNSEIIGKPTDSPLGVVFVNRITEAITQNKSGVNPVDFVEVRKDPKGSVSESGRVPINIYIFFPHIITGVWYVVGLCILLNVLCSLPVGSGCSPISLCAVLTFFILGHTKTFSRFYFIPMLLLFFIMSKISCMLLLSPDRCIYSSLCSRNIFKNLSSLFSIRLTSKTTKESSFILRKCL